MLMRSTSSTTLWCFSARRSARVRIVPSAPSGRPRSASRRRYCCGSSPDFRDLASPSRRNRRMRWRNSASARYSSVVMLGICSSISHYDISANPHDISAGTNVSSRLLERFAESLLGFVVLVAVSFIEGVSALTDDVGTDRHARAFAFARPILRGRQEFCARAAAPASFRDDQAVDFSAHRRFEEARNAYVQPTDDFVFRFRHKNSMESGRAQALQALSNFFLRGGIAQLAGEFSQGRGIAGARPADLHDGRFGNGAGHGVEA